MGSICTTLNDRAPPLASVECPICLYELCDGDHGRDAAGLDDDAGVDARTIALEERFLRVNISSITTS